MNSDDIDARPVLYIQLTYKGVSSRLQFNQPLLRIGRRASAHSPPEIAVDDPTVSRNHAEIRWQGKNYWIADTDSLTGTCVDGERLLKGDRRPLKTGTQIDFGETKASIRIGRQGDGGRFDVCLCHSGADKPQVQLIASELRQAGLNPFFDEESLAGSTNWKADSSSVLRTIGRAADLETRTRELARALPVFAKELCLAFECIGPDCRSSLTKSRLMMELTLVQIYEAEMGREPRKPLLGDMLVDNQFTRRIDRRLLARMDAIREMGNIAVHGGPVEPIDAIKTLDNLCEVLDWHLRRDPARAGSVSGSAPLLPDPPATDPAALLRGCAVAVIWGPNSPGRWQIKEIEVLQKAAIAEEVRLIAVILHDVQGDPEWPDFMDLIQRIDFRKRHLNPMNQLIAALVGN